MFAIAALGITVYFMITVAILESIKQEFSNNRLFRIDNKKLWGVCSLWFISIPFLAYYGSK